jgi:bifunctional non-homologous end joining protein LigD
MILPVEPMKASKGDGWERYIGNPHYIMEEKFDGGRYIAVINGAKVRILSRRLIDKTAQVPQLVQELTDLAEAHRLISEGTIFDGEITADESFSNTISLVNSLPSRGMMNTIPYHYQVFDILAFQGEYITHWSLEDRSSFLKEIFHDYSHFFDKTVLVPQFPVSQEGLNEIWARGGEGVIIKDLRGKYSPGKRPPRIWMKVKEVQTAEGVILNFTQGEGKYADTIGAAIIGQVRGGRIQQVTKISGFTDELRYSLGREQKKYIGQVVEFKFQLKTADSYRHPRFLRFRPDKRATDCRWIDS